MTRPLRALPTIPTVAVLLAAAMLVGVLQSLPLTGEMRVDPEATEVPFGALAPGSSAGTNATNATASLAGTTLLTTTELLYLNNTNATGVWYAKIVLTSSSGISNLLNMRVGIDNGTATDQVIALLGSLTQTSGVYVQLPAASTNTIYVTTLVTNPALTSTLDMDVQVTSDPSERDLIVTKAAFSIV